MQTSCNIGKSAKKLTAIFGFLILHLVCLFVYYSFPGHVTKKSALSQNTGQKKSGIQMNLVFMCPVFGWLLYL